MEGHGVSGSSTFNCRAEFSCKSLKCTTDVSSFSIDVQLLVMKAGHLPTLLDPNTSKDSSLLVLSFQASQSHISDFSTRDRKLVLSEQKNGLEIRISELVASNNHMPWDTLGSQSEH